MDIAANYYEEDNLDAAMQVVMDAFERKGWYPGLWTEFYNRLVCEYDARQTGVLRQVDDKLSMELNKEAPHHVYEQLASAAVEARSRISEQLEVRFQRPAVVTVFLPDAPVEYISGSHGYVSHKADKDKICLPYEILESEEEIMDAMLHEFTHIAIFELAGYDVPAWLNEGLATYLCGDLESRHVRFVIRTAARNREMLSVSYLQALLNDPDLRKDDPLKVQAAYYLSASLVSWWIEQKDLQSVRAVLVDLGRGDTADHAIGKATGMSIRDIEEGWRRNFKTKD